ncbi:hypothetical protein PVAP13_9NG374342 [Panicum virgatum]|uniref:Uncharacterized protein n=1 Tax=Panicum virgatum TaxID=38727 RepID=A0A8T0MWI5_PANVG|nr:hypothetical protein PVAP13_9NG374342 [Panicum virgatum]
MGVRVLTTAILTAQQPRLGRPRRGGPGRASSLRPSSPRSGPASAVLSAEALAAHPRAGPSSSPRRPWSRSAGARSCCRASHALPRLCRQATRALPPEPPRVAGRGRENEERGATPRLPGFAQQQLVCPLAWHDAPHGRTAPHRTSAAPRRKGEEETSFSSPSVS